MKSAGLRKLFKNRRAISAVISNVILIAAVVIVGFAMIAWSQGQAAIYNDRYSGAITSDTEQLRERITFEYIYYDGTSLTVYLMNSGTIDNVRIANVYVDSAPYTASALTSLPSHATASSLNATQEGFFLIPSLSLAADENYRIMIVTRRGSSFVATFGT